MRLIFCECTSKQTMKFALRSLEWVLFLLTTGSPSASHGEETETEGLFEVIELISSNFPPSPEISSVSLRRRTGGGEWGRNKHISQADDKQQPTKSSLLSNLHKRGPSDTVGFLECCSLPLRANAVSHS